MILKKSLSIIQKLHEAGYIAYYAGGWVRDYLLGEQSDEVDIATSATPQEIERLFDKTVPIGKAFGVILVIVDGHPFEVASFRKDHAYIDGRHPETIDFSTPEEDALRRDFTINGMFFDPLTETLYDFIGGKADLKKRIIRAIGNPVERFQEDRLRMMRAVRFAVRLGFQIEETTMAAIKDQASTLLPSVSMERIWQELSKMAHTANFKEALVMLHRLDLLQTIFPLLKTQESIEQILAPLPERCPLIIYLIELLPTKGVELCHYLKTSKREIKLLEYFKQEPKNLVEWAYHYAHPDVTLWLKVRLSKFPEEHFEHEQRQHRLKQHVTRIKNKTPLISASLLQKHGIKPGKEMGKLLQEAEKIAISDDINDQNEILKRLDLSNL